MVASFGSAPSDDGIDLSNIRALSFDCYGTLIDWETGISAALSKLMERRRTVISREAALEAFAQRESKEQQHRPTAPYPQILATVYEQLADSWNIEIDLDEALRFGGSIGDWPAFPDSRDALAALQRRFKLAILSNVDRVSFARSNQKLGVDFDLIRTAEDIGSYKPDPRNFDDLLSSLDRIGVRPSELLHVAQSLYHDHVPAKQLGLRTVWIDRRHGRTGSGATPPPPSGVNPDMLFPDLRSLAAFTVRGGRPRY